MMSVNALVDDPLIVYFSAFIGILSLSICIDPFTTDIFKIRKINADTV